MNSGLYIIRKASLVMGMCILMGASMSVQASGDKNPPPADVINGGVIDSSVYGKVLITERPDGGTDYTFFNQALPSVQQILKKIESGAKLDYKDIIQQTATHVTDVTTYRGDYIKDDMKYTSGGNTVNRGTFSPTSSYGAGLSDKELKEVQLRVSTVLLEKKTDGMSEAQKVKTAHDYLVKSTAQAHNDSRHHRDNAWGALVYHEANSRGYAKAMKALLDAMGVGCYVVSANSDSVLQNYSWNLVNIGEDWYIVDAFADDGANSKGAYLISDSTYKAMGMRWNQGGLPEARYTYKK